MRESMKPLEIGCVPEAAVSAAVLVQTEQSTFLTFNALGPGASQSQFEEPLVALVEFSGCVVTRFGYPNDEAWGRIPRTKGLSYGAYEVLNSEWVPALAQHNQYAFPNSRADGERHFLFLFHDSSFECVARELQVRLHTEPYGAVFAGITQRVLSE